MKPSIIIAAFIFSGLLSCGFPPRNFPTKKPNKSTIYGQIIDENGSAGNVIIVSKRGSEEVYFSTWNKGGQKGLFIVEIDSGGYTIRQKGKMYSMGGGMNQAGMFTGSGQFHEDRSKQTLYFDKTIYIPAGNVIFIGTLKTNGNSITVYYDKKPVDKAILKVFPGIELKNALEIFPE